MAAGREPLVAWWDRAADGPTNMAADERLAEEAERRGSPLVRFYDWSTTTVSLGNFQPIEDARGLAAIRGVPLVRRPSGGGAIVHGSDLTYAVAVPKEHGWGATPQALYDAVHGAMVAVLADLGVESWQHAAASAGAERRDTAENRSAPAESFFCFDRRSHGDLLVAGPGPGEHAKIMGSAQRRLAGVVLQHGSLLLCGNRDLSGAARHPGVSDLFPGCRLHAPEITRAWVRRLGKMLGTGCVEEETPFLRGREDDVERLARRFFEERWTSRR
jgi:lipoate-protein ligase A